MNYMQTSRLFFDPQAYHDSMLFHGNNDSIFQGTRSMMNMENSSLRTFLRSPNELDDIYYYDDQLPEKKGRLTLEQVQMLEKTFETENKLEPERKTRLAKKLGLQPRQVAVWFQNRRARWKNKQLERDYDLLKASYDTLLSNYDSLLNENDKLKSQVALLTETLRSEEKDITGQVRRETMRVETGGQEEHVVVQVKMEDRVSSGSTGGSAVVDYADGPRLLLDSANSYFLNSNNNNYEVVDDGHSFFTVFTSEQHEEGDTGNWWVWS